MTDTPRTDAVALWPRGDSPDKITPAGGYVTSDFARALERELTEARAMLLTMQPFFEKYAIGPKLRPSCLVCGGAVVSEPAITHAELPGIWVCVPCYEACAALAEAKRDAELGKQLLVILSNHCGESGVSEGAVDTLNRIIREVRIAAGMLSTHPPFDTQHPEVALKAIQYAALAPKENV